MIELIDLLLAIGLVVFQVVILLKINKGIKELTDAVKLVPDIMTDVLHDSLHDLK